MNINSVTPLATLMLRSAATLSTGLTRLCPSSTVVSFTPYETTIRGKSASASRGVTSRGSRSQMRSEVSRRTPVICRQRQSASVGLTSDSTNPPETGGVAETSDEGITDETNTHITTGSRHDLSVGTVNNSRAHRMR